MRNKIFTGTIMTLVMIGIALLAFYMGNGSALAIDKSQTDTDISVSTNKVFSPTVKSRVIATHTVEYIEIPVIEVKNIEQVINVPIELREFTNLEELEQWLGEKENASVAYFQSSDTIIDCDDYAYQLQQEALVDGYVMSFQIVTPDTYNSLFVNKLPLNTLHAINLVLIGNTAHYIEPQTGEIAFAANLD